VLQTTLDIAVQHETEQVITNVLTKIKSANVTNAAAVVIDNETGEVLAMTGSADYYNEKNDGQVNGAVSLRQPGSTVKPFVYGLALENGMRASDILPDIDTHVRVIGGGDFIPENYDKKFHGPVRMRTALACSYNVATVNLAARFGPEMILTKLRQAGLTSMTRDARFYGPGICLGTGEVTLLELTRAFSCFAHEGMLKDYRLLEDEPRREMGQVFSPQVAYIITEILSDNQARQPAFGEFSPLRMPFKCMAKTGTSKNFRDNWAIGCTPRYTVGVWAGNFNARAMYSVSGISGSAPIFRDIMLYLERGNTCRDFKRPEWIVKRTICVNSGKIPTKYCNETMEEYFIKGSEPDMVCDVHRHFRIDTRNGLLASSDCPDELVVDKVFEVYPPEFYNWSRDTGNEPPPGRVSDYNSGNSVMSEISYPKDGDVFKIDAVLRKDYQVVVCKPKIYARADRVMWYVDGKKAFTASYPYHFSWKITVGQHEIYMIAHDDKSGQDYKSTVINIRVI
jgi:penicillin-binding protein 1C